MPYYQKLSNGTEITLNLFALNSSAFPSSGGVYKVSTTKSSNYPTATNYYYNGTQLYCEYGKSSGSPEWHLIASDIDLFDESAEIYAPETETRTFSLAGYSNITRIRITARFVTSYSGSDYPSEIENEFPFDGEVMSAYDGYFGVDLKLYVRAENSVLELAGDYIGNSAWGGFGVGFMVDKVEIYGIKN